MKKLVVAVLVSIGVVTVGLVTILVIGSLLLFTPDPLPRDMVLEVDLERGLVERMPDDPFLAYLERERLVVRDVVDALERAREDERVHGALVRVGAGDMGLGRVEEIREAVGRFRESGKPAILFSETFGEMAPGFGGYHLASAFSEVVLQPSGDLNVTGVAAEQPFFRGTLDSLRVEPRIDRREEYKTAADVVTERGFTEPNREATEAALESTLGEIVQGTAEARDRDPEEIFDLFSQGPFMAQEALDAGLVDRLAYRDEVRRSMREEVAEDVDPDDVGFVGPGRYLQQAGRPHTQGPDVAVIYALGPIMRGPSRHDALLGETTAGAETVSQAFRQAVEVEEVDAILFRVDSPGGSYVGSDVIWRAVEQARDAEVPVVVSMGNVAGSGGYLVSVGADRIVAHPSTITASIGVVGGKLVTRGLWERLGVELDYVEVGGNAGMWSPFRDYSETEWERLQANLDRIYDEFVEKVADGRGMTRSQVEEVARGRIWTGRDAQELGLVDELGGFHVALDAVREELEIDPDVPLNVRVMPPPRTFLELILEEGRLDMAVARLAGAEGAGRALETLEPLVEAARRAGLTGNRGPVSTPEPGLPYGEGSP